MTSPDRLPQGRRPAKAGLWALLALALLLACAGGWWGWRWYTQPIVPEVNLAGADPEVAALVRRTQEVVRQQPRSAAAWGQLGMALLANKFEEDALAPLARAEALDPADPRWPYLRGVVLMNKDPDEALPCFRRAAARASGERSSAAQLRLAEMLAANGLGEEAEAHFRAVAGPLSPCAEYGLGMLEAVAGNLAESKAHLLACIASPLTRQRASAQLAALLRRLGEEGPAAEYARRAAQLPADPVWPDPFVAEAQGQLAGKRSRMDLVSALEQQGQTERAQAVLREVARDYPDADSFLTLGITLGRSGDHQESEAVLRRCLELEPNLVRAQYYLSLALFGQGEALQQQGRQAESTAKFEEAARWARRATELDPRHGESHFQLGLTLLCLGRRPEAIAAFRQAVATRPELVDPHLWLGKALAQDGKKDEGVRHLRAAARYSRPDDHRARQALEQVLGGTKP